MTSIGQSVSSLIKLAVLAGCAFALYKWSPIGKQANESIQFAESACRDEARARFGGTSIRVYDVNETNDGYVVRTSITLSNGKVAKVICVTNTHGSVRDVTIDER